MRILKINEYSKFDTWLLHNNQSLTHKHTRSTIRLHRTKQNISKGKETRGQIMTPSEKNNQAPNKAEADNSAEERMPPNQPSEDAEVPGGGVEWGRGWGWRIGTVI